MTETEAIAKLKQGNIDGLETLVQLYQVKALKMAYLTTRDYALAEDVVQSAFVHAYERITQFDSSRPFGPWFLKSVVNAALRAISHEKLYLSLEDRLEVNEAASLNRSDGETELIERLEAAETRDMLLTALEKLTPIQRAVIVLRYYLDLSDSEMVELLNCPPGTVRRRLHDARHRLRHLLPNKEENSSRPPIRSTDSTKPTR